MSGERGQLPKRNDAMGWLMDYYDCLNGEHGEKWQKIGNDALLVLSQGNATWSAWRSIRERGGL